MVRQEYGMMEHEDEQNEIQGKRSRETFKSTQSLITIPVFYFSLEFFSNTLSHVYNLPTPLVPTDIFPVYVLWSLRPGIS